MVTLDVSDEMVMLEAKRPDSAPAVISKRDNHGLFGYLRPSTSLAHDHIRAKKALADARSFSFEQSAVEGDETQSVRESPSSESELTLSESETTEFEDLAVRTITRNFAGTVSFASSRGHLEHCVARKAGRDINCGFRTPFGEDYAAVGGDVSLVPGDVIKSRLLPDGFLARVKVPPPDKISLNLDMTVERTSQSFKFVYFEIDLTDRPLHSNPSRTLHIQWTVIEGDLEIYFSMSENFPYPEKSMCDWTVDQNASELIVYPNDVTYKKAKSKKVTIAIRGQMGFLQYKLRAETQAFLSKLEMIFQERATTKAQEDKKRDMNMKTIYSAIKDSQLRTMRAKTGFNTPAKGLRPAKKNHATQIESKTDVQEEDNADEDMNDLDDIPLRADHYYGHKSQPLPTFLDTVLGNLQLEAVREDRCVVLQVVSREISDSFMLRLRYRTSGSPFALRLDKLYFKPNVMVGLGKSSLSKGLEMPLPSARVKHSDQMISSRGLASSRHHGHEHSRDGDKNLTSARGQPQVSARGQSMGSARGQSLGSSRGQPLGGAAGQALESSRVLPDSAWEPPEISRNRVGAETARAEQIDEGSVLSGRSAKSSGRSGASDKSGGSSSMLDGVHRDEARLYGSMFKFYKKDHLISTKDKDNLVSAKDKAGKKKSATTVQKETGLSIYKLFELLKDMKILGNTALERVPSKRDVTLMCREIFRLRMTDRNPSDDDIVLTETEMRSVLEQIGQEFFEKPLYLVGAKPEAVDRKVWERLRDESNPQKRLQKIAAHPDFQRKLLRAFGRSDKDSDGKLSKEEFVLLCAKEIGLQREDSIGLLQKAGIQRREAVRLKKFVQMLFPKADEHGETDERDTPAARESKLRIHLLTYHLKELTSTMSIDKMQKERANISLLQDQMQASAAKDPELEKQGWLESRDPKSIITNWRKCYCVVEKHAGGGILRIFGHEFDAEDTTKNFEALEVLYLDGRNPIEIIGSSTHAQENTVEPSQDSKKPCVFKVFCKKNTVALSNPTVHKHKMSTAHKHRPGNVSARSETSIVSEEGDGSRTARSGASASKSEAMTPTQSQPVSARSDAAPPKPPWNQASAETDGKLVVQFRICGYRSEEKALEWRDAICASVNELELQTNRVLQELGSLLKGSSSSSKKSSFFEPPTPIRGGNGGDDSATSFPPKRKKALGSAEAAEVAEEEEADVVAAAELVKEALRALLSPASIIAPGYDGAGQITLQGVEVKEETPGGDAYEGEGWEGSGKKGKGGKGRAVHRLPTIAEETDVEAVWESEIDQV